MTSWNDLKTYMSSNYHLLDERDEWLSLVVELDDMRTQLMFVSSYVFDDEPWFEIWTPIGPLDVVDLDDALTDHLDFFPIGGLSLRTDKVCVRHSAPLSGLTIKQFKQAFWALAIKGDEMERALVGGDDY